MRLLKRLSLVLLVSVLMLSFVFTAAASEEGANLGPMVEVRTEVVNDIIYKIEFSVRDTANLYGMSIDMNYDDTIFEVVDHQGNVLDSDPIITPESFFGVNNFEVTRDVMMDTYGPAAQADSYVLLNQVVNQNQIQFAKLLRGQRAGVEIEGKSMFAYLYLRVKEGQTAPVGFGDFDLTTDVKAAVADYNVVCVKLANAQAKYIPYLQYKEARALTTQVTVTDISSHVGELTGIKTVEANLILTYPDTTTVSYPVTLDFANYKATHTLELPLGLMGTESLSLQLAAYKVQPVILGSVEGLTSLEVSLSMVYGDLNGDATIDDHDIEVFSQRYEVGTVNLFDLLRLGQTFERTVAP